MPLVRRPSTLGAIGAVAPVRLGKGGPDERWAAARSASGDVARIAEVADALGTEGDPRVREALFTSLASTAAPEAVSALVGFVRSEDASVRRGGLDALRTVPKAVAVALPAMLADPDPDLRLLACDLARVVPGPLANSVLVELIDHEPLDNVCAAAVEVLAEVGTQSAIGALQRCAARFPASPFLGFAVRQAVSRLGGAPAAQ